jgi:fructosamine-3-kinase
MTDKELVIYFETYMDLFLTDGWKQFKEEFDESFKSLNTLDTLHDEKQFMYRKGQIEVLHRLVNFENAIKDAFEEYNNAKSV